MSNEPDQVNSGALATTIVLVAFATLGVALVVTALVRQTTAEVSVAKDATQERAYRQMKAEQVGALAASPAWTDRATGMVSVPIDSAMQMVLEQVRANPHALSPRKPGEEEEEAASDSAEEGEPSSDEAEPEAEGTESEGASTPEEAAAVPSPDAPAPAPAETAPTPKPVQAPVTKPAPQAPAPAH